MRSARGFSLIEVLVATTVMVVGVATLAQLFALALNANAAASQTTMVTVLAQQKMEQLRAEPFDLPRSPPDALTRDTPGFCDLVDGVYVRRWSVETLPSNPDTLVFQVLVTHARVRASFVGHRASRGPGEVRLLSMKTRRGH